MATIYKNKIKNIGSEVSAFEGESMFILFGDNAPDTLKDFCYTVDIQPVIETIEVGHTIEIDGNEYKITAIGNVAEKNLESLGHVTIVFDGSTEASLPGSIYVEGLEVPKLSIGSEVLIKK
ncbi:PTS glucitol/sorbitol transporter subunit IIA [Terrisporobacter vanillatitrophus]|uniref:PTS glucitol/sorbitol transporter subunit IIA n=1 Tax=Terrisporobacter vanillatitrophus TaxID=3058402 RepID=UPI0033695A91